MDEDSTIVCPHIATMTSYTHALFAVATGAPMAEVATVPTPDDPGNWLCCFWKEMADRMRDEGRDVSVPTFAPTRHSVGATFAPTRHSVGATFAPTRHGLDAVVDELFRHTVFQETLGNATDIIDHIALSYLPAGPPAFWSLWDHVIVPAWQHHATVHRLLTQSTE